MGTANDRQVGGQHYRQGGLQHWDLVHKYRMDYFVGQVTRYLSRAHLKNGREDYEKAVHYIDKRAELGYPEFIAEKSLQLRNLTSSEHIAESALVDFHEFCGCQRMPPLATLAFFKMLGGRSDVARDAADYLAATFTPT